MKVLFSFCPEPFDLGDVLSHYFDLLCTIYVFSDSSTQHQLHSAISYTWHALCPHI